MDSDELKFPAVWRLLPLVWLLLLYAGLTYLAVGTISVSQIDSRFGDQASYIFHLADVADQQRNHRMEQLRTIDMVADEAARRQQAAMAVISSHAQRLGVSPAALSAALADSTKSVRLEDLGVRADESTRQAWDSAVTDYYYQTQLENFADQRRAHLLEELRGGWARLVGDSKVDGQVVGTLSEAQFQAATSIVAGLREFGYRWMFAIPSEVLTLVLALVLGALGSALHMTKVMLEETEKPHPAWYIIRPCQGVLMALVVFVLLKAGQLTMGAGDADALNPFFVAFVGTVSGLLATDAYRLIQRAGASIIPANVDEGARWAFGLSDAMAAAGVDPATLAAGIGAKGEEVQAWMTESVPVPAREQALIAAWLHGDARALFTADPPPAVLRPAIQTAVAVPAQ